METSILEAREAVEAAGRVVVFTGAGISAESGVPTFRGSGGLWRSFRPEQLANPMAFSRDPRLVWEWYQWRRTLVRECAPNPGHRAVAEAQVRAAAQGSPDAVRVITQNVDGLHARALSEALAGKAHDPAMEPIELHGSLFRLTCSVCDYGQPRRAAVETSSRAALPRCPECGKLMRPAVVWFGEMLEPDVLDEAHAAAGSCDLCLVVGTSAVVEPAASLPRVAAAAGATVVEVNLEPTALTPIADIAVFGPAGETLPALLDGWAPDPAVG